MPEFTKSIPVLAALDLKETIAFYLEKLGFTGSFIVDNYGGVSRDAVIIHFWLCPDAHIAKNTSCRVQVKDVNALYEQYQKQNLIHPNGKIANQPWGNREFAILDNNGNLIWFFEPLAKGA